MLLSWVSKYDGRGTAAARKDLTRLGKTAISTKISVAALTYAFANLAKASIQSAMAEEQSITQLNKALSNAGFAKAQTAVNDYILSMQDATGISKKELRPAFLQLFNTTNDVGAAQQALKKSLDISAGTGKDLSTTVTALSRAFAGNRESIKELNTGLDASFLKTASLVEIIAELDRKFRGQAAAAAATTTGELLRFQVQVDTVTQSLGKGFIEKLDVAPRSMSEFAGGLKVVGGALAEVLNWVDRTTTSLSSFGDWFVNFARDTLGWSKWLQKGVVDPIGTLHDSITGIIDTPAKADPLTAYLKRLAKQQAALEAKALAERLAKERAIAKEKAKQLALTKRAAQFDMELIQIAAAKTRNISAESRARLNEMEAIALERMGLTSVQPLNTLLAKQNAMNIATTVAQQSMAQGMAAGLSLADATAGARYAGQGAYQYYQNNPVPSNVTVNLNGPTIGNQVDQVVLQAMNNATRSGGIFRGNAVAI